MELNNISKIVWDSDEKLSRKDILEMVNGYLISQEMTLLQLYDDYYESENTFIYEKVKDKHLRKKTPNNQVPTSYYSTLVDTMAGFMFANVQYIPKSEADTEFSIFLNDILDRNNYDVKEMKTGTFALAYNKGIELVYTVGDGQTDTDIKYTAIDPRQAILVYDNKIEPDLFCMIWVRILGFVDKKTEYKVDVIYKDQWQYYYTDKDDLVERSPARTLYFNECPVVAYYTNNMSERSSFHKVIRYIDVLDFLITGNANDIESLTDAILVLTKILKEEDLKNLNELKAIMDIQGEDRAEFLVKNMSPEFREYASKLLIREIHKHSHIVDYFSPDNGLSGEVSGRALRIRLFDMNTYSQKIEKIYKLGAEKRVRLISSMMTLQGMPEGQVDIVYNRNVPDDFEELAPVLNQLTFISDKTKLERLGFDAERELEKLTEQKEANIERMALSMPEPGGTDEDTEENEDQE